MKEKAVYLAEQELRDQFNALEKTTRLLQQRQPELQAILADVQTLCVLGCGSSYSIAKSSALQFTQRTALPAYAIAAGDMLVNFESYHHVLQNATLLLLSRSGSTSELLFAAKRCREQHPGIKIISICAVEGAPAAELADVSIEIPWAFDKSVCQTRTVSNLYAAALLLAGLRSGDAELFTEMLAVRQKAESFCVQTESVLSEIGGGNWENMVVLADSGMAGIAEEGALAAKEICQRPSNFYHLLDVRHGPIVMVDKTTLVVVLVSRGDQRLQLELVKDIAARAGRVLALACAAGPQTADGAQTVQLPAAVSDDISALFMLYCIQLICLKHAVARGVNPDRPKGLDAWIELEG